MRITLTARFRTGNIDVAEKLALSFDCMRTEEVAGDYYGNQRATVALKP